MILLARRISGNKTPQPEALPATKVDPAQEPERLTNKKRYDDKFKEAFGQWIDRQSGVISGGRWIPKGAVQRFLTKHHAPNHSRKT